MNIKALIFDVDGTLGETEEAHRQAFNETFAVFELPWFFDRDIYAQLLNTTGGKERMAKYVRDHLGEKVDKVLIAEIHAIKTETYGNLISGGAVKLRPGIKELINDARQKNIRLAIATTTSRPNVDRLVKACFGVCANEIFEVIAAGDEVANKKPAPDVFALAVKRLGLPPEMGLPPENCVALEDSRNGLLSAKGAGVKCVVSPAEYTLGSDFSEADAIVDCFSRVDSMEKLHQTVQYG